MIRGSRVSSQKQEGLWRHSTSVVQELVVALGFRVCACVLEAQQRYTFDIARYL